MVKAYTDATLRALEKAEFIELEIGTKYKIELNYNEIRNLEYNIKSMKTKIISSEYNENIEIEIIISSENMETLKNKIVFNKIEILEENVFI